MGSELHPRRNAAEKVSGRVPVTEVVVQAFEPAIYIVVQAFQPAI